MTSARNADDFQHALMTARKGYEDMFGPMVQQLRSQLDPMSPQRDLLDENLEVHVRKYVVDRLLEGLNWRIGKSPEDDLPNMIPEAAIRSQERGARRYLDYFGFEENSLQPLLIVETKRPGAHLPENDLPPETCSMLNESL